MSAPFRRRDGESLLVDNALVRLVLLERHVREQTLRSQSRGRAAAGGRRALLGLCEGCMRAV